MARLLLYGRGMRVWVLGLLFVGGSVIAGCGGNPRGYGEGCRAGHNPLDAELCKEFEAVAYQPVEAPSAELCNRLWIDMLGVRPTRAEVTERCEGRPIRDVVISLQRRPEYRETQRRRWADRFRYSEYFVDVRSIRELDALVDLLYKRQISYSDFAVEAMASPGFSGRFIGYGQPDQVAQAAFQAFLGRDATRPEALDLGNLWRPWTGGFGGEDPQPAFTDEPYYYYGPTPYIDPWACEAGVRECRSSLLGDAVVSFPRNGREQYLSPDMLTEEDRDALKSPGRLFVTLPMFWEAQVDEVLTRYLGYDLGTRLPEARQALVRWFKSTNGDVVRLERAVLTSWAYRQSAFDDPANPKPAAMRFEGFAWGPTKPMIAEAWLSSLGRLVGRDLGNCDWRYPNLPDWYYPEPGLDQALGPIFYGKNDDGSIDRWFRDTAGQMGGCPGSFDYSSYTARTRSTHIGLMTSVAQEEALVDLCLVGDVPALLPLGVDPGDLGSDARKATVKHVLSRVHLAAANANEVEEALFAAQDCPSCSAETIARDLCAGLAGGIEWVFY